MPRKKAKQKYTVQRSVLLKRAVLHTNPWNPNHMTERQSQGVSESIEWVGQVQDLVVRPHPEISDEYQVIDGEHRLASLGEDVYCTIVGGLTDAEAKKLTIIMNETRGQADKIELAQLLKDISIDIDDDQIGWGLPYEPDELNELIALADVDWDKFSDDYDPEDPTSPPAGGEGSQGEVDCVCPSCGHKFIRQV